MLEGFGSKYCLNFEGFTNSSAAPRITLHKTRYDFNLLFLTTEVKQILFKILAFLVHGNNRNESITILLQVEYVST